jgi:hypothetical protein
LTGPVPGRAPSTPPGTRLVRLLSVGLLLILTVALPGAGRARATDAPGPGAQPEPGSRVAVLVDTLEPATPQPTDVLRISGSVLNRAAEGFDDVEVSLHLGPPATGRTSLADLRADPVAQPLASRPVRLANGRLEPGQRLPFALGAPVSELLTRGAGVYPLQVTVVGRTTEGLRDLGRADTFLPYVPSGQQTSAPSSAPLPIAWVMPVTDQPRLTPAGGVTDGDLAAELAPGGRLDALLDAATALPAGTLVVDPALVSSVDVLTRAGYPIGPSAAGATGSADPDARSWLAQLSNHVVAPGGNGRLDAVPIPFADADLEALLHAGRPDLAQLVTERGRAVFQAVVGSAGTTRLAAPPDGRIDQAGADFLAHTGANSVLLAPDGITRAGTLAAAGTEPLAPVLPDPELNRLVGAGAAGEPTPRLAEQSVLAELAQAYLSSAAAGGTADPLVIAPPAGWDPGGAWASRLTEFTAGVPWLRPIGATELSEAASVRARRAGPTELRYPPAARGAELPADLIPPVAETLAETAGFAEALPARQTTTQPVTDTALTALSAAWRTDPAGSQERRLSADAGLDELRRSVRVVASPEITLTSRNGRLPVTLENNLPESVTVTLVLTSLDRSRVRSDTSVSRTIQPGQKVQVEVAVRATSAGTFPVRLALQTPTGRQIGPAEQVLIRSTAAGVVAIGVTVAALAVLVLTVVGRAVRSLLRRRSRPPGGSDPGGPDSGGSDSERAGGGPGDQVTA